MRLADPYTQLLAVLPSGSTIIYNKGHGSSLWSQAAKIVVQLKDGTKQAYFIKLTETHLGKLMAEGEYQSSKELYRYAPGFIPRPIAWGTFDTAQDLHWFMTHFVDIFDEQYPSPHSLCSQLAAMHERSRGNHPGQFGFHIDNCNGTVQQCNTWCDSWEEFFSNKVDALFEKEQALHGASREVESVRVLLLRKVIPRLLRPLETDGRTLEPVLVHGDIWHANTARQVKPDTPALVFDAAALWAHNEYDLHQFYSPRYLLGADYVQEYFKHFPPSEPAEDVGDRGLLYSVVADLHSSILHKASTRYRQFAINTVRRLAAKYPDGYTGTRKRKGT